MNRLAALLVVCALASCAVMSSERRLTLNYLDEHAAPSTETGRWLLAPVALPAGLLAGAADAVVVHPMTQFDDAWRDTVDLLWDFEEDSDFRTVLLTPLRALATPVLFAGDWVTRAVFDVDDHPVPDADEDADEDER